MNEAPAVKPDERSNDSAADGARSRLWYQTAVRTAIVGAVFSAVVLSLLIANYVRRVGTDERRIAELDALKIEIQKQPEDEAIQSRIRELDLRVRQERIKRNRFSSIGGWLMLAGCAVSAIGVKCALSFGRQTAVPAALGDVGARQIRSAGAGRWAVGATLAVLGGAALWLAFFPEAGFNQTGQAVGSYPSAEEIAANWPRFRGPGGLGISSDVNVPTRWDANSGEGIVWKRKVPLAGYNSPVVWEGRVFLCGADEQRREVYCFDAAGGELLWTGEVSTGATAKIDVMEDTGLAAPTMVTDGRRVCAIFANGDVGCFDVSGRRLWVKSLGVPENAYGYASSPFLYRNLLLIQWDQAADDDGKS